MRNQQLVRRLAVVSAVVVAAGGGVATPARAAGSVINIGLTVRSGGLIKGSGSWTNNGDWTSACVRIFIKYVTRVPMVEKEQSIACRTGTGSASWSAPDVTWSNAPFNECIDYYTKITAYKNGNAQSGAKTSNRLTYCFP